MADEQQMTTMAAIVRRRYGGPEFVQIGEVPKPQLPEDGILVRVRAASLNQADWHALTGTPVLARPMLGGILKPKSPVLGSDFAGVVEQVGSAVTDVAPGEEVFGGRSGSLAEYVDSRTGFARKPANLTFEEAAAVPVAALTALQGLRDHGHVQAGQHVLVNGASGGVGTFAIQITKALGAHVTAVCSTRNMQQAGELGADEVLDYTTDDFTRIGRRFHVVLDIAVTRPWSAYRRALEPDGRLVIVGSKGGRLLEGLGRTARVKLASLRGSREVAFFIAKFSRADMDVLRVLAEQGKIRPVIERRYELSEVADGLRYLGEGHARGKLVVTIEPSR